MYEYENALCHRLDGAWWCVYVFHMHPVDIGGAVA